MSLAFPHVNTLNGQFWKRCKVPTPFHLHKRDANKISWIHGPSFERECARQYLENDTGQIIDYDLQKRRLLKPSELETPRLTSRHPSPDFVTINISDDANACIKRSLLKTNQLVFYVVQPPWQCAPAQSCEISKYYGDMGHEMAERFQCSWKKKMSTDSTIFAAWIVCRVTRRGKSSQDRKAAMGVYKKTQQIVQAALKKSSGEDVWAQRGTQMSIRARDILRNCPNPFKLRILQIIKPDIASHNEERSVSLAICQVCV